MSIYDNDERRKEYVRRTDKYYRALLLRDAKGLVSASSSTEAYLHYLRGLENVPQNARPPSPTGPSMRALLAEQKNELYALILTKCIRLSLDERIDFIEKVRAIDITLLESMDDVKQAFADANKYT